MELRPCLYTTDSVNECDSDSLSVSVTHSVSAVTVGHVSSEMGVTQTQTTVQLGKYI